MKKNKLISIAALTCFATAVYFFFLPSYKNQNTEFHPTSIPVSIPVSIIKWCDYRNNHL